MIYRPAGSACVPSVPSRVPRAAAGVTDCTRPSGKQGRGAGSGSVSAQKPSLCLTRLRDFTHVQVFTDTRVSHPSCPHAPNNCFSCVCFKRQQHSCQPPMLPWPGGAVAGSVISQTGKFQVRFLVRACTADNQSMFLPLSLFPPHFSLSVKSVNVSSCEDNLLQLSYFMMSHHSPLTGLIAV